MSALPEYMKHVKHTHADMQHKAWCGAPLMFEASFVSIDHLAYVRLDNGRLLPCPKCLSAIVETLKSEGKEE